MTPDADVAEPDLIERAVRAANPNVLRVTLFQLTGDPDLTRMRMVRIPIRGGASYADALADEHHAEVQAKALAYLRAAERPDPTPPSEDRLRELMSMMSGEEFTDSEFRFALEELALDDFPREARWRRRPAAEALAGFRVAVVGAGISGLAAAVQLERLGIPYTIYERLDGIGGTWHLNDYPEARVDVSSFMYQFKFEKNYPWPEFFSPQPETKRYLQHIASKYGIAEHIRLNTSVTAATWDDETSVWHIDIEDSDGRQTIEANALISCSGLFSTPRTPDIPGLGEFDGPVFHTTAWDHSVDLVGKRVALIGNGSSGSQLMPHVAEQAAGLYAFQRTPNWVSPVPGYRDAVPEELSRLFDNLPFFWNWFCFSSYIATTRTQPTQEYDEEWVANGGLVSERNDALRRALTEYIRTKTQSVPGLFEKCLPDYAPMARRLVVDNGWYDALCRDDVELVTDGITRISADTITTGAGDEIPVDVVILGAGFEVSRYLWPVRYTGREGISLEDLWSKDGARAYLGMTIPGFPNMFVFYGPDGQPRAGGFYSWAEIWSRYVVQAIVHTIETGSRSLEVRKDVFEEYNAALDEASQKMIWTRQGQGGYYLNEFGRSGVNMPWRTDEYYRRVEQPDPDDFVVD